MCQKDPKIEKSFKKIDQKCKIGACAVHVPACKYSKWPKKHQKRHDPKTLEKH